MGSSPQEQLRAYVTYLRDLGIYDLYRRADPHTLLPQSMRDELLRTSAAGSAPVSSSRPAVAPPAKAPAAPSTRPFAAAPPSGPPSGPPSRSSSGPPSGPPSMPEPPSMSYFDTEPPIANLSPALAAP